MDNTINSIISSTLGGGGTSSIDKLTQQILASSDPTKWSGQGYGSAQANAADMAKILSGIGITDLSQFGKITQKVDVNVRPDGRGGFVDDKGKPVDPKLVREESSSGEGGNFSYFVAPVGTQEIFGNKATGQAVPNTYSERQTGNAFGGTFTGKGNTGYRVDFDAQGNPHIYTTGASSSDIGSYAPLLALGGLALGAPYLSELFGGAGVGGGTALSDLVAGGGADLYADLAGAAAPTSTGALTAGATTAGGLLTPASDVWASEMAAAAPASEIAAANTAAGLGAGAGALGASTLGNATGSTLGGAAGATTGDALGSYFTGGAGTGALGAGVGAGLGGLLSGIGDSLTGGGLGTALGLSTLGSLASGVIGANAATTAADKQAAAANYAADLQKKMFDTLNQQQAPYRAGGYSALNTIGSMMPGEYTKYDANGNPIGTATGNDYFTHQFNAQDFQNNIDPGYAWRLQQGQMAQQRMANKGGGLLGANALQGLQDYTQGQASQEYQNAFNRYTTNQSNIYNRLASLAGIGQAGQSQVNTAAQNAATNMGNLAVGSAGAQAAGGVGAANAYGNALGGIGNNLMLAQLLNQKQNIGP